MKFPILSFALLALLAVSPVAVAGEPAQLTDAQKAKIALIHAEIQAQIEQLKQLESKLVAAVVDKEQAEKREPAQREVAEAPDVPMAGDGLVGRATVGGDDAGILFIYAHGKILNPEPVRERIEGDFVLTLSGELHVPHDMVVKVWHAGGGVSHDVNTLFVDEKKISSVGDDRKKSAVDELKLEKGAHAVRWELTGGTFRNNLLKFADAESGGLLPLGFAKAGPPDVPTREVVRVGSEKRGWPIPEGW